MEYKDLPLDQRIELASQYALLLVADIKSNEEIIGILKQDYALTDEQAIQAFTAMRSKYRREYNTTVRSNALNALGSLGFSLLAFLFYYFVGKDLGRSGTLSYVIAFFFGIGALGAFFFVIKIVREKLSKPAIAQKRQQVIQVKMYSGANTSGLDNFDKTMGVLFLMSVMFLCGFGYNYFFNTGVVNEKKITTIHQCIVTEPVRHVREKSGKSFYYYYALKLRGHNLECRFLDDYYEYIRNKRPIRAIQVWDTVSIQVFDKDLDFFNDQYSTGKIDLVNLGIHGHFLLNHAHRNADIKRSHKTNFYVLLTVFAGLVLVALLKKPFLKIIKSGRHTAR
jgi:hypothetical protein